MTVTSQEEKQIADNLKKFDDLLKDSKLGDIKKVVADNEQLYNSLKNIAPEIFKIMRKDGTIPPNVLNDIAKNLVLGGVSMIPGVGGVASTIIGLLWPNVSGGPSELQLLEQKLTNLINQKVSTSEKNHLISEMDTVQKNLNALDELLQGGAKTYSSANAWAIIGDINTALSDITNKAQSSEYKVDQLPLYTTAATMHLVFLKFIEINKGNPELGNDQKDFDSLMTRNNVKSLRDLAIKYRDVIEKNAQEKEVEFQHTLENKNLTNRLEKEKEAVAFIWGTEMNTAFKTLTRSIIVKEDSIDLPKIATISAKARYGRKYVGAMAPKDFLSSSNEPLGNVSQFIIEPIDKDQNIYALRSVSNNHYVSFNCITTIFRTPEEAAKDNDHTTETINYTPSFFPGDNVANTWSEDIHNSKGTASDATYIKIIPLGTKDENGKPQYAMKALHSYAEARIGIDDHNRFNAWYRENAEKTRFTFDKVE
ncbi:hypothetical protein COC69_18525 [Bacillus cereus]|uniref:Crystaline entomocidal protoxin n=2 Tax=Bacillus cereus TaxID=1396 RepID=A0A9X7CLQ0_BACCE|nr:hypothetical protein COC69_18525 [Bacillus cereus]